MVPLAESLVDGLRKCNRFCYKRAGELYTKLSKDSKDSKAKEVALKIILVVATIVICVVLSGVVLLGSTLLRVSKLAPSRPVPSPINVNEEKIKAVIQDEVRRLNQDLKDLSNQIEKANSIEKTDNKEYEAQLKAEAVKKIRQLKAEAVKKIRQSRHPISSKEELIRLRMRDPSKTAAREEKIEAALNSFYTQNSKKKGPPLKKDPLLFDRAKVLLWQALEIKDIYQDDDVFIHAQATHWMTLAFLIKAFVKKHNPDQNVENFTFLRNPKKSDQVESLKYYVKSFENLGEKETPDKDMNIRKRILSVTAYVFDYRKEESAISFLLTNSNILGEIEGNRNAVDQIYREVIRDFCPKLKEEAIDDYVKEIRKLEPDYRSTCGNVVVVCVPPELSSEVLYRAHPGGKECHCHGENNKKLDKEILKNLQNQDKPNPAFLCPSVSRSSGQSDPLIPQYRIDTYALKPSEKENQPPAIPIHALWSSDKEVVKEMKKNIQGLVNRMPVERKMS